jgi:hypothetical protein
MIKNDEAKQESEIIKHRVAYAQRGVLVWDGLAYHLA